MTTHTNEDTLNQIRVYLPEPVIQHINTHPPTQIRRIRNYLQGEAPKHQLNTNELQTALFGCTTNKHTHHTHFTIINMFLNNEHPLTPTPQGHTK